MNKILKSPIVIISILMCLSIGILIVNLIGEEEFLSLFMGSLVNLPLRYIIILLNLFVDYIVFENINNYMLIVRYRSIQKFLLKSTIVEIFVTFILFLSIGLPILLVYHSALQILPIILFIMNGIIVVLVFLSMIRLLNVWVGNRFTSTMIFIVFYTILDMSLDQIAFSKGLTIFTFKYILVMPMRSGSWYPFIFMGMLLVIFLLMYLTLKLMGERDYILKNDVDDK